MKRKIVNGLLMMAFTMSSVSGFVACKDYDEDVLVDLKTRIDKESSLREALQKQVTELEALVKSLETCKCDLKGYLTAEQANLDQYLTKVDAATKYMTEDQVKAYVQSQAQTTDYASKIASLEAAIGQLQTAINTINSKLGQIDVNTNEIAKQAGQISVLNTTLLAVQSTANEALELAKKAGTSVDLTDLTARLATVETLVAGWDAKLTSVSATAENAAAKAAANAALIAANRYSVDSLAKVVKDLNGGQIAINLTEIQNKLKAIEDTYVNTGDLDKMRKELEASVQQAQLLAQLAMDLATANKNRLDEMDACSDCLISRITALEYAIQNAGTDFTTTTEYITIINDITNLQTEITKLDTKVDMKVGQLKDSLAYYVTNKDFQAAINKVNSRVDSLAQVTKTIEGDVNNLVSDIQNMITSIEVHTVQSPVVGYVNTPVGINSNIFAVYYGTPLEAWDFPSTNVSNYVNGMTDATKWTSRNLDILGVGGLDEINGYLTGEGNVMLITEKDGATTGNAGTLYVTVNPANVNFVGKTLKLKDSQDGDAPAVLSPLVRSDRKLYMGYSRAADNGFYEAQATISDVSKAKLNVDYNAIKDDAKALLQEKSKNSALELASTLVKNFTDVMPAYSVMGSWTDESSNVEHKIYSQYNTAALAVQPLSLNFLSDWKGVSKMPGLDRVQNTVGEIIDKINVDIDLKLPNFAKYKGSITFTDIKLPAIDDDMLRIKYYKKYTSDDLAGSGELYGDVTDKDLYFLATNVKDGRYALVSQNTSGTVQQMFIYDPATGLWHAATTSEIATWGAVSFELEVSVDINKTPEVKATLQDIVDDLNDQFGSGSDLAKNITNLLNDVASLDNIDANIDQAILDAKTDIKTQINKYITKANNKLTSWFNRAPGLIHLALLQQNDKGTGLTSMSKKGATKVSGTVKFVPTTYNVELVAPTYKKFLAVTDVFNADGTEVPVADAKTMAAAVTGGYMGRVIDGNKICTMNPGKAGYIYELTYTAVDYFGKVAIRKYYVRF